VTFDRLTVGTAFEPWSFGPITRTDIVRYQGASGDLNPVHHDEPFARASGYPAPLGVGMLTAGLMNTYACRLLGPERVRRTRMRWKKPVFPGTTVTFDGKVVGRDEAARTVDVQVEGRDQDGATVVQGWLTFSFAEGA
jgi:acyl dehydratase